MVWSGMFVSFSGIWNWEEDEDLAGYWTEWLKRELRKVKSLHEEGNASLMEGPWNCLICDRLREAPRRSKLRFGLRRDGNFVLP
jgi:hypothetical protein